jgi:hypothetical protein
VADPIPPKPNIKLPGQLQIPGLDINQPDLSGLESTEQILKNILLAQDQIRQGWGNIFAVVEGHKDDLQAIAGLSQNIATSNEKTVKSVKEKSILSKNDLKTIDENRKAIEATRKAEEQIAKLRSQGSVRKWEKAINRADMVRDDGRTVVLSGLQGQTVQQVPMTEVQRILQKQASGQALSGDEKQIYGKLSANVQRDLTGRAMGIGLDDFSHGGLAAKGRNAMALASGAMTGHFDMAALGSLLPSPLVSAGLIGGYEFMNKVIVPALAQRRALTQLGQISGQGFEAGLGARVEAFGMGANPFDMISQSTAMAIVKGVREAGFSGAIAQQLDQGVKGTIEDLGISVDSSIKMMSTAMRQGQESVKQIADEMKGFDTAARAAGESVQQFTDNVQATSDTLRNEIGSGRNATGEATGLESFFSQRAGFPSGTSQTVAQMLSQNRFLYAGQAGVNPLVASTPQLLRGFENFAAPFIDQAMAYPDAHGDPNKAAEYLKVIAPQIFGGMSIPAISAYIRQTQKFGKNAPTAAISRQRALQGYSADYASITRRQAIQIINSGGVSDRAMSALGIGVGGEITVSRQEEIKKIADWLQHHPTGRSSGGMFGNVDQTGAQLLSGVDSSELTRIRRNALRQAYPFLSDAGRRDLAAHLDDFHDNFQKRLQDDIQKHRRRQREQGDSVNALPGDTIVVTIDPKTKKTVLSNNADYNTQTAYGAAQANQRPPWDR